MVACTECANHNVTCFYDREQSVKCSECLRYQRNCDGTFSVEEFRKVGEQKKQLQSKSRRKRREIARLRQVLLKAQKDLLDAEESDSDLQDSIAKLEEQSSRMLRREMEALGVFDSVEASAGPQQELALADPDFIFDGQFVTDSVDWDQVLGSSGDTGQPVSG